MEQWEIAARLEIQDVFARATQHVDRGKVADLARLFTEDAVHEVVGHEQHPGRDGVANWFDSAKSTVASNSAGGRLRHHTTGLVIDFATHDEASVLSYYLVMTADGLDHWGTTRDQLVRREGRWLFSHRSVRVEGFVAGSFQDPHATGSLWQSEQPATHPNQP